MKYKVVRLKTTVHPFPGEHRLQVTGIIQTGPMGHHLPFHYIIPAHEPFDHEGYLAELDRQAQHLGKVDTDLRAWVGFQHVYTDQGHEVTMRVTDCQLMFHAISTWEVYCAWDETHDGVTSHHETRWPCKEPQHAISLKDIQDHVETLIATRLAHHKAAADHIGVLNAIADAHQT